MPGRLCAPCLQNPCDVSKQHLAAVERSVLVLQKELEMTTAKVFDLESENAMLEKVIET